MMTRAVCLATLTILLGACTTLDCGSSLCGCPSPASKTVTLRLADADGRAVSNARLICHDAGSYLGQTNTVGLLSLQVQGANTPGCGFMPDCQVAYFRNSDDSFGRHFWFARFVRGEDVSARAQSVELIDKDER